MRRFLDGLSTLECPLWTRTCVDVLVLTASSRPCMLSSEKESAFPASPSRGLRAPAAPRCLLLRPLSAQSWRPGGGSRAGGGQLGGGQGLRSPRSGGHPQPLPPCTGHACGLVCSLPGGAGTCRRCQGVKLSVAICPVSLAPCALGGRVCSAPTGTSSRGQAADRPALVPLVGVGREAPGCSGKQADWGASLEL